MKHHEIDDDRQDLLFEFFPHGTRLRYDIGCAREKRDDGGMGTQRKKNLEKQKR
jgi:hypothetical protein